MPNHELTIRNELGSKLKNLSVEPRDGVHNDLEISIVDLELCWFQLRITLPTICVFADTDHTMTPGALLELNQAVDTLLLGPETAFVDLDNESADTARIVMTSDGDGMTRLTIIDWCADDIPPRLDIKASTATVVSRFKDAISHYAATSAITLVDLVPAFYLYP